MLPALLLRNARGNPAPLARLFSSSPSPSSSPVPCVNHNDQFFRTNDGVQLRFTDSGGDGPPLVLLHGWTANGRWFDKNTPFLSENGLRVVTLDYRGMGDSEKPGHGTRVSRISKDVKELLDYLALQKATLIGTSMGFTVISLYYEMFQKHRLAGVGFVDQTAAQFMKPGWEYGSPGNCAREMVIDLQAELKYNPSNFARAVATGGFGVTPPTEEEYKWFSREFMKCDLEFCGRLMEDHANLDMRDLIPHMKLPVLNFLGGSTKCHNFDGMAYIGEHAPNALNVTYDSFGHWLYWEDADRFNKHVLEFVNYVHKYDGDDELGPPMEQLGYLQDVV
eukprot:CAMPEP_0114530316 /NCGR_PEP_ID=MMETSP0109-20121206/25372_1 /TAXON_ID=29199 /ORGANISM="Chlorarachnion reptans, Strain CCCM449" /LENGTH=334 /DNA_ID=CAMNT_0001712915 /DNA_START=182 /DNA_END=1186 /DNA_ORIENTATION=-